MRAKHPSQRWRAFFVCVGVLIVLSVCVRLLSPQTVACPGRSDRLPPCPKKSVCPSTLERETLDVTNKGVYTDVK